MYQTHKPQHNLRFALTCVAVLAIACVLRLQPWRVKAEPAAQPVTDAPAAEANAPIPAALANVVFDFYDRVDRGQYGEAYDLCLENQWKGQPDGSYQHAGLTPKQELVDALTSEFGINGVSIHIDAIQILDAAPLPLPSAPTLDPPEYAALAHLPAQPKLTALHEVHMAGSVGDSCTPLPWHKRLIVAGFEDGQFKVLLAGGPRPESTHKSEWFTDGDPFAGSQLSDQEQSS